MKQKQCKCFMVVCMVKMFRYTPYKYLSTNGRLMIPKYQYLKTTESRIYRSLKIIINLYNKSMYHKLDNAIDL